jgi:glycosidase
VRNNPQLYEVNARIFLSRLSATAGHRPTLATIPDQTWLDLVETGFDLVWLMGAWQRSPAARQKALSLPGLRQEYATALPGWSDHDVSGSPYAIYSYSLDPLLGEKTELAGLRHKLNSMGLGLILDFVPNHLALDHPWVHARPQLFVPGGEEHRRQHPDWFFSPDGNTWIAHGRDPYFPPWTDTAQVNFRSAELRDALVEELLAIAAISDGVRCDMAMLGLNEVFQRTWGDILPETARPDAEFWDEAIGRVKARYPSFTFIAEAYWGLDRKLQGLGFDFTYDKAFYDRLRSSGANEVHSCLTSADFYNSKSVRFIENHDEPRAAAAFGRGRSQAAAVVIATLPGLRLFHDGQLEGKQVRLPVQLVREPEEAPDPQTFDFYRRLLASVKRSGYHDGHWQLVDSIQAWPGNGSHQNLLAWSWSQEDGLDLVVVNYSSDAAQGRLQLHLPPGVAGRVTLRDELNGITYIRIAAEIHSPGLYVTLEPWNAHLLHML